MAVTDGATHERLRRRREEPMCGSARTGVGARDLGADAGGAEGNRVASEVARGGRQRGGDVERGPASPRCRTSSTEHGLLRLAAARAVANRPSGGAYCSSSVLPLPMWRRCLLRMARRCWRPPTMRSCWMASRRSRRRGAMKQTIEAACRAIWSSSTNWISWRSPRRGRPHSPSSPMSAAASPPPLCPRQTTRRGGPTRSYSSCSRGTRRASRSGCSAHCRALRSAGRSSAGTTASCWCRAWVPTRIGDHQMLTTCGQPFWLDHP
ncbi:hypothetical protein ACQ4PT_044908 [Festuca glaucescens]